MPLEPDDRQRVTAETAAIRDRTGTEVVVVVRYASDHYALYPPFWAAIAALAGVALLGLFAPGFPLRYAALLQAVMLLILTLVFDWMPLRIRLVPEHIRHALAHAMAHREFATHALAGDPARKLILLYVSQAERYLEVIADHATHQAAGEETWAAIVAGFSEARHTGTLGNAVVEAVRLCGAAVIPLASAEPRP